MAIERTFSIIKPDATGASALAVSFNGKRAAPCGPGCYSAVVPRRRLVRVIFPGGGGTFLIPKRWPSAERFTRRATAAFRRLKSVGYVESLSSGSGVHLLSHFRLEAPNRLSYAIRGGADGIVIGTRRWDRPAGGGWRESETTVLPQPTPIWGVHPTGARFLSESRRYAVVSFLDRSLPAWFVIHFDRRTLRPTLLHMTAPAHFMAHHYTAFNDVAPIVPPTRPR